LWFCCAKNNPQSHNLQTAVVLGVNIGEPMPGTKIYCPSCKDYSLCESLPFNEAPEMKSRFPRTHLDGVKVFLRLRFCNKCSHTFTTAEVPFESIKKASELFQEIESLSKKYQKLS
jgi:ribosomal protein L44E